MPLAPDQFDSLLRAGDAGQIARFFAGAAEMDRRALAPRAVAWHGLLQLNLESDYLSEKQLGKRGPFEVVPDPRRLAPSAYAALLACAELPALSAVRHPNVDEEMLIRILADRRPAWLQNYADVLIEADLNSWSFHGWHLVRALVRAGLCTPPRHPNYSVGAIPALGSRVSAITRRDAQTGAADSPDRPILADLLTEHPDWLVSGVWGLFEFEGTSEVSLANSEKYSKRSGDWTGALIALSRRGVLPREKLLDASLDALSRDFVQFRAGWFSRFHEALQPTPEERIARLDAYLNLIASAIPPTVSFALKAISGVCRGHPVPGRRLLAALAPALQARAKGTAISALELAARLARDEPGLRKEVSEAVILALLHDSADVQKQALDILDRHGDRADAHIRAGVAEASGAVAASLRPRLAGWIDQPNASAQVPACASVDADKARPVTLPRVDPSRVLAPITDLESLIALAAKTLEGCEDPDELEQLLDAFSRLCDRRPEDFTRLTAPLRKRAAKKFPAPGLSSVSEHTPESAVAELVGAWTDGDRAPRPTPADLHDATIPAHRALVLWQLRFDALVDRVAHRVARPLLSSPSHRGGWIEPRHLVERWRIWTDTGENPPLAEQILALQRLAPEGRAPALEAARALPGEGGAALRFALGQTCEIGENPSLWLAACRSRAPRGPLPEFAAKHPGFAAYIHETAVISWEAATAIQTFTGGSYTRFELEIRRRAANGAPQTGARDDFHGYPLESHTMIRWWAHASPANQEPCFEEAAERLGSAMQYADVEDRQTAVFLEPLSEPHCELHDMARLTMALALGACGSDLRGHARDRLVKIISDGRLNTEALGETMSRLLATGATCFARWGKTLKSVAEHSPPHARTVCELVQITLGGGGGVEPRHARELLELLIELLSATGAPLSHPKARACLESWKVGGKTGRLIKQLLAGAG